MATHSNILARIIPWTEEPGRLQSMGSQRVGYDLANEQQQLVHLLFVHLHFTKKYTRDMLLSKFNFLGADRAIFVPEENSPVCTC